MGIQLTKKRTKDTLPVKYHPSLRTPPKLRWIMLVLLLSIPLLILIYQVVNEYILVRFSGLITYDTITLRAPDDGYIKSLNVQAGENIRAHQVILIFNSPTTQAQLQYLRAEKKRLIDLMNSLQQSQITPNLEHLLDVTKEDIETSKAVYERFKNYVKKGDMIELQLEEARRNYISAQRNYALLKQQMKENKLQTQNLIEVNYKRKILELESKINQVLAKKQHFTIHAQQPGTIMDIKTHEGEYVSAGQPLVTIVTEKNIRIIAFIDPKYVQDVYQGKKVTIILPDKEKISGQIVNTPSYAEKIPLSEISPLATRSNKLIAIIKPETNIPEKYEIFGIPVTVKLD
ncbi:HlyD family efflux transporter periplasmic adaptor subunit [Legionella israelensis]|uniref:HlyD family efflux transporter periplasmic adaptor subunit n=1 Tax=Legionella israelensis TaxID=454 RepID=A0AAX1EDC9_9GAMM|nr:HlyD family efflux transporter periplasmic adaptor subunit [Legionella israelensis]QBR82884.1 HlyD family efflux transporter periplasmic adaptor subunit [Legionella israelensis]